jgi:hypothetical protein
MGAQVGPGPIARLLSSHSWFVRAEVGLGSTRRSPAADRSLTPVRRGQSWAPRGTRALTRGAGRTPGSFRRPAVPGSRGRSGHRGCAGCCARSRRRQIVPAPASSSGHDPCTTAAVRRTRARWTSRGDRQWTVAHTGASTLCPAPPTERPITARRTFRLPCPTAVTKWSSRGWPGPIRRGLHGRRGSGPGECRRPRR